MDLTRCPECAEPAEIQWRRVAESTGGPLELAKVFCVRRHWFLLPVAMLAAGEDATTPATTRAATPAATPLAGRNERGLRVATARGRRQA